jgi:multidrug efflux pump subunit AcrB
MVVTVMMALMMALMMAVVMTPMMSAIDGDDCDDGRDRKNHHEDCGDFDNDCDYDCAR